MIRVPYHEMNFYFCNSHYDIHLSGICIYKGKLAKYVTHDLTDYQEMTDTCPSCGVENLSDELCHCTSYVDVECEITELTLLERIQCWFDVNIGMRLWYIRRWGINGIYYWKNWYKR
jgi:hypothetical protein